MLVSSSFAAARLASQVHAGDTSRVQIKLEVGGELSIVEKGKVKPLKMSVAADLAYDERFMTDDTEADAVRLALRHYSQANATIKVDSGSVLSTLRDIRRMVGIQLDKNGSLIYSPLGSLTRDELDLVDVPCNTLAIDRLLPGEEVEIGDTWEHADDLMTSLLCLDAVSQCEVKSELKELDSTTARIDLSGSVQGAIGGVSTDIDILGRYKVDLALGRVTWMAMLIKEKRSIGHVGPGLDIVAKLQVAISPEATSSELDQDQASGVELTPATGADRLVYTSKDQSLQLEYDRRWHIMNESIDSVAMRLVDRGDLMAQCNIAPLAMTQPGAPTSLEKFQDDIRRSLGKNFGQFAQATESSGTNGTRILKVVALGNVEELPIQWNYFHVSDAEGHQAVFAFTVEAELASRIQDLDRELVDGLSFRKVSTTAANQPTEAAAR